MSFIKALYLRLKRWFFAVPVRSWIILTWLIGFCLLIGSWSLFALMLPLYWQIYLKRDLAGAGW